MATRHIPPAFTARQPRRHRLSHASAPKVYVPGRPGTYTGRHMYVPHMPIAPVKGGFPGPPGKRRPTPGSHSRGRPHLICPRLDIGAYPSRGSALDLADAQTGSLSDPWLRPRGRPYFDALCQAVSLFLSMKSGCACPGCAGQSRVTCACSSPRPGRMGCLGAPYAAVPPSRSSSCTWRPMAQIQRTSSLTTATLALLWFLCISRARWS